MDKTVVFVFRSLDIARGGLTKAVLTRANTLVKNNTEVIFLTLAFQPRFDTIINTLYSSESLDNRVKVINFFNDTLNTDKKKKKSKDILKEKGYFIFQDTKQKKQPSYRYYKDGLYIKYKRYDESGNLLFIDYMNESRHRYQRDEFNVSGDIIRSRQMDLFKNKPRLDRYYDNKGKCGITVWIDDKGNEKKTLIFNKDPKQYSSLEDVQRNWIEKTISKINSPILISDSRKTDNLVAKVKSKKAKKIAVLHNNHFQHPYDNTAKIKKTWDPFFNNIKAFNRIVFLTEEQKLDIEKEYGKLDAAIVIPHAAPEVKKQVSESKVNFNPNLAVTLARYTDQKRLDEAIKSFSYVIEEIPDAEYHIYGFGDKQKELEQLIKKLNLTNKVKLLGFTSNVVNTYKSASCSILTSDFEGFGMVLTESLSAGTPVVSYDIKYGPKDIIRDGKDGFLVEKGNKKAMADKIISIMKNNELRNELSSNSIQVSDRFSFKQFTKDWEEAINNI